MVEKVRDKSCFSIVVTTSQFYPDFIYIVIFEAVILTFCIPYTFMSAVLCALEI